MSDGARIEELALRYIKNDPIVGYAVSVSTFVVTSKLQKSEGRIVLVVEPIYMHTVLPALVL